MAEGFLIAWRRLDDMPAGTGARAWLYAVARKVLANQARASTRRQRLTEKLGAQPVDCGTEEGPLTTVVHDALAGLAPRDREVLLLFEARRALAATAAAASGTMTMTAVQGGATETLDTTSLNGSDVAISASTGILSPNRQLLLVGGGAYVHRADGRWLHYASENNVGPKLGPAVQLAHDNVAGNTAQQVLALSKRRPACATT